MSQENLEVLVEEIAAHIPKGQLPDSITVNSGEDLIKAIKYFVNKPYKPTTVCYHEYEIEVIQEKNSFSYRKQFDYLHPHFSYRVWDCEHDRYVYGHKNFESKDSAIVNAKNVIDEVREELYHG